MCAIRVHVLFMAVFPVVFLLTVGGTGSACEQYSWLIEGSLSADSSVKLDLVLALDLWPLQPASKYITASYKNKCFDEIKTGQ